MFAVILQYRDDDAEVVACSPDFDRLRLEYWDWVRYYADALCLWNRQPGHNPMSYSQAIRQTLRWVQLIKIKEV